MELREFITQSLVQLSLGVSDAQKELAQTGARINPKMSSLFPNNGKDSYNSLGWAESDQAAPVFLVDFDVAVTATDGTNTKGGIGVVAGVLALGSQGASENRNTAVTRIQFKVPLMLPSHEKTIQGG